VLPPADRDRRLQALHHREGMGKQALVPQGVRAPVLFSGSHGRCSPQHRDPALAIFTAYFNCYNFGVQSGQQILLFFASISCRNDNKLGRMSNGRELETSAMKCPFCGFANDKVVDSRESKEAESIRRRRECLKCGKRFTTYERIDEIPYMVVKKDGRREKFDRQKVLNGLLRACEKRPVPISKLEQIVNEAESFVLESAERERKTSELGELIMNRLRRYDKVAYVRFASVYLDFKDVKEFMNELKDLVKLKAP
jgi:transcriptional repressor NrdR